MLDSYIFPAFGILTGCMILGLVMQVINFVRLRELEYRILMNQAKILSSIPDQISMEDLMLQSIQKASVSQNDFDNMISATNEEIFAMLKAKSNVNNGTRDYRDPDLTDAIDTRYVPPT